MSLIKKEKHAVSLLDNEERKRSGSLLANAAKAPKIDSESSDSENEVPPIFTIPHELLLLIMAFVPWADQITLKGVCKDLASIVHDMNDTLQINFPRQYQHHINAVLFTKNLAAGYALRKKNNSNTLEDVTEGAAALIQLLGMTAPNDAMVIPYDGTIAPVTMPSAWIDVEMSFIVLLATSEYAFEVFLYAIFKTTTSFANAICAHLTKECNELTGNPITGGGLHDADTGTKTSYKSWGNKSSSYIYLNVYKDKSREIAFDSWEGRPPKDVSWSTTRSRYRVWFKQHGASWTVNTMLGPEFWRSFAQDVRPHVLDLLFKPRTLNSNVVELRASFVDATLEPKKKMQSQ